MKKIIGITFLCVFMQRFEQSYLATHGLSQTKKWDGEFEITIFVEMHDDAQGCGVG
jgi:hypothetical protein